MSDLLSKVCKEFKNKIKDYSEIELLNILDDIKESKYENKIISRIKSDKESGKSIVTIDSNILFDNEYRLMNRDNVIIWLDEVSNDPDIDLFIFSEKANDKESVKMMTNTLELNGFINFSKLHFVKTLDSESVIIHKKSYIYQGKLPSIDTIKEIAKR